MRFLELPPIDPNDKGLDEDTKLIFEELLRQEYLCVTLLEEYETSLDQVVKEAISLSKKLIFTQSVYPDSWLAPVHGSSDDAKIIQYLARHITTNDYGIEVRKMFNLVTSRPLLDIRFVPDPQHYTDTTNLPEFVIHYDPLGHHPTHASIDGRNTSINYRLLPLKPSSQTNLYPFWGSTNQIINLSISPQGHSIHEYELITPQLSLPSPDILDLDLPLTQTECEVGLIDTNIDFLRSLSARQLAPRNLAITIYKYLGHINIPEHTSPNWYVYASNNFDTTQTNNYHLESN